MEPNQKVLNLMEQIGGSFASALAKAWQCADANNQARLMAAFGDLYKRYAIMQLEPKCLITGCDLQVTTHGQDTRWVHGDLHRIGAAYVFNAVVDAGGGARWSYENLFAIPKRFYSDIRVISVPHDMIFERRGVIIFDCAVAELNKVAANFLLECDK